MSLCSLGFAQEQSGPAKRLRSNPLATPVLSQEPVLDRAIADSPFESPPESVNAVPLPKWGELQQQDERRGITIVELQNLAIQNNPELAREQHRIQAAQGEKFQNSLTPAPILSLSSIEVGDEGSWGKQEIGIEQEIITGHKTQRNVAVAQKQLEKVKQEQSFQLLKLQTEITLRAYDVLAAQKTVQFREEVLKIDNDILQTVEKLHAIRENSLIDLVQVRNARNENVLELNNAKREEELNWQRLSTMLGLTQFPKQPVLDPYEVQDRELSWDVLWSQLQQISPKLLLAKSKIQLAHAELQRSRSQQTPNVTINGGAGYDNMTQSTYGNVGLSVPIQGTYRNRGNVQRASAELASANREYEMVRLTLYEQLAEVFSQYEKARHSVVLYQQNILPDAKLGLELTVKGYQKGECSYVELLRAKQIYIDRQCQYIQFLKQLLVSTALIDGLLVQGGIGEGV
ncbi:MAG: TolC family protein [Thermoguttaceae bacterium]